MRIASFNANGIRARLPLVLAWLEANAPDVLCVQETKVQDRDFPVAPFRERGYHCTFRGQKSYNGVAFLSRHAPSDVRAGFDDGDPAEAPRLLTAVFDGVTVINTYIPQGQSPTSEQFAYKLQWFARLKAYFAERFDPAAALVWTGDFNVAPQPIDVYDPDKLLGSVGYHPQEHRALTDVMDWGFRDVYRRHHPDERAFTFWDYRVPNAVKRGLGWRIDHICATRGLAARCTAAWIDLQPRLAPRPSDHTVIAAEFDL